MEPHASDKPSLATDAVQVVSPAERPAGKFMYPGGTRPLDGYTLKRGIGQGGFGEIYYALSDAGKEVALKLIRRNLDVELRGIRQCLNLKHPNLLALFDIRQDDIGDTWVIMEFVAGTSLQEALETHPQGLTTEEALAWIHGLGAAVAYLHDHGIVHRDLKPGNVFSDEGVVKVGDYGLSKFISCSRRSGHTESIGTVHYMAPEVANGRYGKEIDVYAMGVILYEMLTGRVPFDGESVGEVLMKHLTARPDLSPVPEPYKTVVARALEKDPEKRYPSAAEMLAALPPPPSMPPGTARLPLGSASDREGRNHTPLADHAVLGQAADEEPIYHWFRGKGKELTFWWQKNRSNKLVKIALLFSFVLLYMHFPIIITLAFLLIVLYGIYWGVRSIVLAVAKPQSPSRRWESRTQINPPGQPQATPASAVSPAPVAPAVAAAAPVRSPRERHWRRHPETPLHALVLGTPRQRVTELLGSLLLSTFVAAAMTVVLFLISSYRDVPLLPEQCGWLLLVAVAGAWTILIASKLWEGTQGEPALRRFVMMVLGLGLGVLACGLMSFFEATLPPRPGFPTSHPFTLAHGFFRPDGQPLLPAFLASFGTLFLLIRWWRQADPLRSIRLSLWSLVVSTVLAGVAAYVWQFPQPWLPMLAAAISVSVQLSSPWLSSHQRRHPRL